MYIKSHEYKKKRKKKNIEWRIVCIRNGVRGSNIWVTSSKGNYRRNQAEAIFEDMLPESFIKLNVLKRHCHRFKKLFQ